MRRHLGVISQNRPVASQLEQLTQLVGLISAILGTFQNALYLTESALEFVRTDLKKDTQS